MVFPWPAAFLPEPHHSLGENNATTICPGPGQPSEALPDHTQLPEKDGTFVHNFQEHPQSNLLTSSLQSRLGELHPDGQYCIGHDSGIYWRYTQPPLDGCKAPDWFYVPDVPPMLNGQFRRSYVLWQEAVHPMMVIEYVSGDGSEERDTTPYRGKFWVYERAIGAWFYAIFEIEKGTVELFKLREGRYHRVEPNEASRLPIEPLGVELGIWQGTYRGMAMAWLLRLGFRDRGALAHRRRTGRGRTTAGRDG